MGIACHSCEELHVAPIVVDSLTQECFVSVMRDEATTFMCGSGSELGFMLNLA